MRFPRRMEDQHPRGASSYFAIVAFRVGAAANQAEVWPCMNMKGQVAVFRIADVGEKQIIQAEFVNRFTEKPPALELLALSPHLE